MIYDNLVKNNNSILEVKNKVTTKYLNGLMVEINGPNVADYKIEFKDSETGYVHYVCDIKTNMWAKCTILDFIKWEITIWENGKLFFEKKYDFFDNL